MSNLFLKLSSSWKKLLVWLVATILLSYAGELNLTADQIQALSVVTGGYLVGQGIMDVGKGKALLPGASDAPSLIPPSKPPA